MMSDVVQRELLAALRAALQGQTPPEPELDGEQWNQLLAAANRQNLLPLLFEQLRKLPAAEEYADLFAVYRRITVTQVAKQIAREADFAPLYRELRRRGLHPLVLKGPLLGRLYPLPTHRITTDCDLLLPPEELARCHQALLDCGLRTEVPEEQLSALHEISYEGPNLLLELHLRLFEESQEELNPLFAGVAERAMEVDGLWTLSAQDHLLYLLLHACKHFIYSGVGLRQAADVGLWARAYGAQIDWPLLWEQCRAAQADGFAEALFRIAQEQLGIAVPGCRTAQRDTEPLLQDMLEGGVFGANSLTRLHTATVTVNAVQASRRGERRSLWRSLFPRRTYLLRRYPWLDRLPALLPLAWLLRMGHYAWEVFHSPHNHPAESMKLARERLELLQQYGLIE